MGNMGEGMIGNKMIIPEEFKHIVDHICNRDLELAHSLLTTMINDRRNACSASDLSSQQ